MHLKDHEVVCIKKLAALYEQGKTLWRAGDDWATIGLSESNRLAAMMTLKSIGVVDDLGSISSGPFSRGFTILPSVIEYHRQILDQEAKKQEPKDVLETLKYNLKRHPIGGWIFVVFAGIGAIAFVIHNVTSALRDLGIISK